MKERKGDGPKCLAAATQKKMEKQFFHFSKSFSGTALSVDADSWLKRETPTPTEFLKS